jgi:DNA modification methylase
MKNKLYNGDCLKIIEDLFFKGVQVDAIITDPPYNISKKNGFSTMKNAKRTGVKKGIHIIEAYT